MLVLALVDVRIFFPQKQNLVIFVLIIRNFKIRYSLSQLLVLFGCVDDC